MSIKILEFRQKDSNNVIANGYYENTLNNDTLTINEGDQIAIKNVFLDTTSQAQFKFDNDVNLVISYGIYIIDWWTGQNKDKIDYQAPNEPANINLVAFQTGGTFIPYTETDVSGGLNPNIYENLVAINFVFQQKIDNQNTLNLTYTYNDVNNNPQVLHKTFGPNFFNSPGPGSKSVPINLLIRKGSFKDVETNFSQYYVAGFENAQFGEPPWGPVDGPLPDQPENYLAPVILNTTLTFPKGIYSPTELALKLSETLTNNFTNSSNSPLSNPFLKSVSDFYGLYWYEKNLNSRFQIVQDGNNPPKFSGASQIDVNFDSVSQKFNLEYLHFPLYDDDTGSNISIKYLRSCPVGASQDADRTGPVYTANKHSGIYFNSLESFDSTTNERLTFWENLGFNLELLCAGDTQQVLTIFPPPNGPASKNIWTTKKYLIDGVNTIGGFVGLDSIVVKGGKNATYGVPNVPTSPDDIGITSTSEATTTIDASLSIPQIQTAFSHYLVELNIGFSLDYTDQFTMYQNIASVVSRYYSYGSYLSDTEGAIVYTHKGAPLYIRSGKIRILTGNDKELDPLLGPDNTIIVQIIKNS